MRLEPAVFESLAAQAIDGLPDWVRTHMDNVAIVLEQTPTAQQLRSAGVPAGNDLLGLYEGVPLTERGRGYQLVPPDRITLFQRPLERHASDERGEYSSPALVQLVRQTIIHEIAHHFGFSEQHLRELGC
jgi:predicted Zn-dependent protease with MMP-like domain